MKDLRTILSVWPNKKPAEPGAKTGVEAELVFSCDLRKQFGYFHLKRGKWAGKWVAKLKCCENPFCHCADVSFSCAMEDVSESPPVLHFALDPMKRAVALNHDKDRHPDSAALAEAMASEFGEEDWRCLRQYLLTRKRNAIRDMDVIKLPAPESLDAMTDDGRMVPFGEVFPFGGGFEFELDGEHWMADDQYCVMPDCDCREVVLNFLFLTPSPDDKNNAAKAAAAVARYDYKRDTIRAEREPAAGRPSLRRLIDAALAAHPSLVKDMELRHNQLKILYARASLKAERDRLPPVATPVESKPKVGRNDPCPCGSGKKYKKCCGRAA